MIISFEGMDGAGKTLQLALFQKLTGAIAIPQFPNLPKIYPATLRVNLFQRVEEERVALAAMISPQDSLTHVLDQYLEKESLKVLHPYDLILLDRSVDTTFAYSWLFFREKSIDEQDAYQLSIASWHHSTQKADLTFLFQSSYAETKKRLQARTDNEGEFDMMPQPGWEEVASRYAALAENDPHRIVVIDADGTPEVVSAKVREAYIMFLQERVPL